MNVVWALQAFLSRSVCWFYSAINPPENGGDIISAFIFPRSSPVGAEFIHFHFLIYELMSIYEYPLIVIYLRKQLDNMSSYRPLIGKDYYNIQSIIIISQ